MLYAFLRYYSRFDWATYCVTINGPVRKSDAATGAPACPMPERPAEELLMSTGLLDEQRAGSFLRPAAVSHLHSLMCAAPQTSPLNSR